jgi:hypothetical protein
MLPTRLFLAFFLSQLVQFAAAFSMKSPLDSKTIYDIPKSGWTSPEWNWGYATGTGHDCAAICRQLYSSRNARASLVQNLIDSPLSNKREPQNFEEIKLILALAWQNGRWDGSDGGLGGYGEVLSLMAAAERYEIGSEEECSINFVNDLRDRFHLLKPEEDDQRLMSSLLVESLGEDVDGARRRCSGLVLKAMGFIENG